MVPHNNVIRLDCRTIHIIRGRLPGVASSSPPTVSLQGWYSVEVRCHGA
jgi:hypothetical protein